MNNPAFLREKNDYSRIQKRKGSYLPHWNVEGAIYHVSFRLIDSLPRAVLDDLKAERAKILEVIDRSADPLTKTEKERVLYLFSEKVDIHLDRGHGRCWLRAPEIADLVSNALKFFDGDRYRLYAWCVMPNHVHAVVKPEGNHKLPEILQSWKGYTAREINRLLGRTGKFWQQEYFDRIVRNEMDLVRHCDYVFENPDKAGLANWTWCWKTSAESACD